MSEYLVYRARAALLTPLHIGSGRDLLLSYDYAVRNERTWRLNEEAILEAQNIDDPGLVERLMRIPPAQLLKPTDFQENSPFFRYVIRGTPRSTAEGAQLREQLKDAYNRPYLPGTSLKGALRTALAWYAWRELGLRPERTRLNPDPRFAAQGYERAIFGSDPNHDLLRALHVADSAPVGPERLILVNARVLHRSGRMASPIELEAIAPDTVFHLTIKLDLALFSDWARRHQLAMRGEEWLQALPTVVNRHTAQRVKEERAWFNGVPGAERIEEFYKLLTVPAQGFLLQVGWGTGWDDKTFGSRLRADPNFLEGILRPTRAGGYGIARGRRQPGDPFPKSRRVVVQVQRASNGRTLERPVAPLGWVLVEW
ncbi:MAG: type III-A CRISPR-associated RAMP protein Csm5 [Anaerolineae bacterium]|nr:type III-A CRISPR-associated RAMP protein Csm5 [Anaerolineae bacterium]MDW8098092.1 type III-A CRISPR-associated RAMP protein Csm5 [Anaerolineae bacterium]